MAPASSTVIPSDDASTFWDSPLSLAFQTARMSWVPIFASLMPRSGSLFCISVMLLDPAVERELPTVRFSATVLADGVMFRALSSVWYS